MSEGEPARGSDPGPNGGTGSGTSGSPGTERELLPMLGVVGLFAATEVLALALAGGYADAGLPGAVAATLAVDAGAGLLAVLIGVGVLEAVRRYGRDRRTLRAGALAAFAVLLYLPVVVLAPPGGWRLAGALAAGGVVLAVWAVPEWYVIDIATVLAGASAAAVLGSVIPPPLAVALLVGLAVYDAYSVYYSGGMETVAGELTAVKLPALYVVPHDWGYAFRTVRVLEPDRVAMLGIGDAVVPGVLVVSAGTFATAPPLVAGTAANPPAVGALVGAMAGMTLLQALAFRVAGLHAGLPPLSTLTVLGYLGGILAAGGSIPAALGLALSF